MLSGSNLYITKVNTCTVGAIMVPHSWMQTTVTLQLSDFRVDHKFTVGRNPTTDCLLGANFLQMYDTLPRAGLQDSYSYKPD